MLCYPPAADLMHTLWEADVTVFKAHITTNPASDVLDMFWIYDNRHELPDHHRRAITSEWHVFPPGRSWRAFISNMTR